MVLLELEDMANTLLRTKFQLNIISFEALLGLKSLLLSLKQKQEF